MIYLTGSETDTFEFGRALGARLKAGDCVLLTGDLGAGKSVVARGIAAAHGVMGPMPSPTFVLMIPYEGDVKIYHFDLYRLMEPEEFYQVGLEEFIGGDGIAVIEWPQMAEISPPGAVKVDIARGDGDDGRVIDVTWEGREHELPDAWRRDI